MKKNKIFELIIAFLFTFLGGYADAYTFILRGGTFSTMQTGNLIKFFIGVSNGQFFLMYLLPIIFFCLGSMIAILLSKFKYYSVIALFTLLLIYLISGFCPQTEAWNIVCVSTLSVAGAIQFEAFHKCLTYNYTSTMCTNNMRLFSNNLVQGKFKQALFYLSIIACFCVGLVSAVLLNKGLGIYSICVISSLYIPIFILRIINKSESKIETKEIAE